jgi:hypothetical protein
MSVRASHLLVKHCDSRRPASWRDPEGTFITKKVRATRRATGRDGILVDDCFVFDARSG